MDQIERDNGYMASAELHLTAGRIRADNEHVDKVEDTSDTTGQRKNSTRDATWTSTL